MATRHDGFDGAGLLIRGIVLFVTLLAAGSFVAAEPAGRCYSADVPGPLILPDGSVQHRGAHLRVCLTRMLSPVAGLHETSIDGAPIGGFVSRVNERPRTRQGRIERAYFEFVKDPDGNWVLSLYAADEGTRSRTYLMRDTSVSSYWNPGIAERSDSHEPTTILLAADRD